MTAKVVDAAEALANANAPSGSNPFVTAGDLRSAEEEISGRHETDMGTLRDRIERLSQKLDEAQDRITVLENGAVINGEA